MDRDLLLLTLAEYLGVIAVVMIAGTSQRFVQRQPLVFKYPRREGLVSLVLFVAIFAASIVLGPLGLMPAGLAPTAGVPEELWQHLILALLVLFVAGAALMLRQQPIRSAGWGRAMLGSSFRLGLALIFLTLFLRGKLFQLLGGISADQGMALLLWLAIALAEETVFRGYIQLRLSSWLGPVTGWLITALMYTLWQAPLLMTTYPDQFPQRLAIVAAQAVLVGWIMRRTGHVLASGVYRAFSAWLSLF